MTPEPTSSAVAAAVLSADEITVQPGGDATLTLTLHNTGTVVEGFEFDVLGDCRAWADTDPSAVSLLPGDERTVTVHLHPPRGPIPLAGRHPIGVLVRPASRPAESVVVEGDVVVAPFTELAAQLRPVTSRAAWRPHHQVDIENAGNTEVDVSVTALDQDNKLTFKVKPPTVTVPPGGTARARLAVRVRRVTLLGGVERVPFSVVVQEPHGAIKRVDGAVSQRPVLARWVPRVVVAAAAVVVGGFVYANVLSRVHDQAVAAPTTTTTSTSTTSTSTTTTTTSTPVSSTTPGGGLTPQQAATEGGVITSADPCTPYNGASGVQSDAAAGTITLGGATPLTIKSPGTVQNAAALAGHFTKLCILGGSAAGATVPVQQGYVWLPSVAPFTHWSDVVPTDCKQYDPNTITVRDIPGGSGGAPAASSVISGGSTVLLTLADHATALRMSMVAQHHNQLCWIGATIDGSGNVVEVDPKGAIEYWD